MSVPLIDTGWVLDRVCQFLDCFSIHVVSLCAISGWCHICNTNAGLRSSRPRNSNIWKKDSGILVLWLYSYIHTCLEASTTPYRERKHCDNPSIDPLGTMYMTCGRVLGVEGSRRRVLEGFGFWKMFPFRAVFLCVDQKLPPVYYYVIHMFAC